MNINIPMTYKQYGQVPFFYANGLGMLNNALAPNTSFYILSGTILDSTETFQMINLNSLLIDATVVGLNGIDTGALAANKLYNVFLVSDPLTGQPTGGIISLSATPYLPFSYSAYALIGYIATDASSHFLQGYWTNNDSTTRLFMYDTPQTVVNSGHNTAYVTGAIDLSALVPPVDNNPVFLNSSFTPNAADNTLSLQPTGATGDAIVITGQFGNVPNTMQSLVMSKQSGGIPKISYKVTSTSDSATIKVAGYYFSL